MRRLKILLPLFLAMLTVPLVQCTKKYNTDKQMLEASENQKILTVSEAKDFLESAVLQGESTKSTDEDIPDENGYVKYVPGEYTADWANATNEEDQSLLPKMKEIQLPIQRKSLRTVSCQILNGKSWKRRSRK